MCTTKEGLTKVWGNINAPASKHTKWSWFLIRKKVAHIDPSHLQQVLHAVVAHVAAGEQEIGDVDVGNAELTVNFG